MGMPTPAHALIEVEKTIILSIRTLLALLGSPGEILNLFVVQPATVLAANIEVAPDVVPVVRFKPPAAEAL